MIHLETITPDNWRLELSVWNNQKKYVSDSMKILARAYAYRNDRSRAFIIYLDDTPIGMAMYYDIDDMQAYNFSQFFIDRRYQGKGYGFEAAKAILNKMEADGKYNKIVLCYVKGDNAARNLYEKLGFRHTGFEDGDEIVMEKAIR